MKTLLTRIYSGAKIKQLMLDRGMSLRDVARACNLTGPAVWKLVHEQVKDPSFTTLMAVAAALGVPVQRILRDDAPVKSDAEFLAVFNSLTPANRAALTGAAAALLETQKKKK